MTLKSITLAVFIAVVSLSVNAEFIDNRTFTSDSISGQDWLDLTETAGLSYNFVSSQLGAGGDYEGWRYATGIEIDSFFGNAGGSGIYTGWSASNNGFVSPLLALWGDISAGSLTSLYMSADDVDAQSKRVGYLYDKDGFALSPTQDYVKTQYYRAIFSAANSAIGSALVRETYVAPIVSAAELLPPPPTTTVVPVPAAIWLFFSGLLGLIGIAKRKVRV